MRRDIAYVSSLGGFVTTSTILLPRHRIAARTIFLITERQQHLIGGFLVLHALAHAGFGLWAAATGRLLLVSALWELATVGFLTAGLGALGISPFRAWWRSLSTAGAVGSLLLFLLAPHKLYVAGLLIDVAVVAIAAMSETWPQKQSATASTLKVRISQVLAWMIVAYVSAVVGLRPWDSRWGTTAAERAMVLPGDELVPVARYQLDHGITINAPANAVWPWLNQIGQERGGFYSYSRLENVFGARVTNADRIVSDWAPRKAGDFIRAVPADWLGGRFGDEIGWRVLQVIPGRALVLEGWGAFVLNPMNPGTTRMLIRTRGEGVLGLKDVLLAPATVLVFEPAHFIMQREMLRGIKSRAEKVYLEENLIAR